MGGGMNPAVNSYLGIPYAAPIRTYAQRWTAPQGVSYDHLTGSAYVDVPNNVATSLGYLNAAQAAARNDADLRALGATPLGAPADPQGFAFVRKSNICMQRDAAYTSTRGGSPYIGYEDCLYLNIYTPYMNISASNYTCTPSSCSGNLPLPTMNGTRNGTAQYIQSPSPYPPLLPVLVFLHGGNFANGSSYDVNGADLVQTSVNLNSSIIVVTLNYRIGVFGFLSHKDLSKERKPYQTSGLYGFEDQRLALQFVSRNILAFGGNPYNVTLMGDSSGAIMACMHVFSPRSAGLFSTAIMQG
jgi:carboxylesterase type B